MRISDWSSDVCSSDLPAHARKHVHILFGGLELVERAGRRTVEIEPEEVGGSEHADRIIGIDRNSDACELTSILAGEDRLSVRGDQPGAEGRETIFVDPRDRKSTSLNSSH